MDPPGWLETELESLASHRHADPARGLETIDGIAKRAGSESGISGLLAFHRGVFLRGLARTGDAQAAFEEAIAWAGEHDQADIEARARANLAVLLTDLGRTANADKQMALATDISPDSARGVVEYLKALLLQRRGQHHDALQALDLAQPLLEEADDQVTLAGQYLNRGVALIYLDDHNGALLQLAHAEAAATGLHLTTLAAMSAHNRGFLEARKGHLADALASFDRAEGRYLELLERPRQLSVLPLDRAEVLLQAGLATDARISVGHAITELEAAGNVADLSEARLLLARACLAADDFEEARRVALQAAREFRAARRSPWIAQAAYVARQVDYYIDSAQDHPASVVSRRFERLSLQLHRHGWPVEGRDSLVFGALAALGADDIGRAETLLEQAAGVRASGAAQHRARFHLANALLLRASGEQRRAHAVVKRGVADARQVLGVTGSTEARLEALRFAGELANLGTELAVEQGKPISILRAIERQRSLATNISRVGAEADPELDDVLQGLRLSKDETTADTERAIRERSLRAKAAPAETERRMSWQEMRGQTGDRPFVYYLDVNDEVHAVVVRGRDTELFSLASTEEVQQQIDFAQFAVQRLGVRRTEDRARTATRREADRLFEMLIKPLGLAPGPMVVVPSPAVRDVLWALLPQTGHHISLVASGVDWLESIRRPDVPTEPRALLVSGPRLETSEQEVEQIAGLYSNPTVLAGADATVGNVLDAFADVDLVHIAAHGVFRAESPMFSRLELFDGPLTIYDLERLRRLPPVVVLAACEVAASHLYPSGGALGTAAALNALGARSVVAPVQPIQDSVACEHMAAFHRHLIGGASPSRALRLATADADDSNDAERIAAAAMFVTIGAG